MTRHQHENLDEQRSGSPVRRLRSYSHSRNRDRVSEGDSRPHSSHSPKRHRERLGERHSAGVIRSRPLPPAEPAPLPPEKCCCGCCTWPCGCRIFLGLCVGIGLTMALIGIVLVLRYRDIFIHKLIEELPVISGSFTYSIFKNPPAGLLVKMYFFHLKNADDVISKGDKPKFKQIGPYVYTQNQPRDEFAFNRDETELFYTQKEFYKFNAEASNGRTENDTLTQLDFVAFGGLLAAQQRGMGGPVSLLLGQFNRGTPFKQHRIGDLLWGSEDRLYKTLMTLASTVGVSSSGKAPPDKFGLMYGQNGTNKFNFTVFTGKGNIDNYLRIKAYNGQTGRLANVWPAEDITDIYGNSVDANVIRGVTGSSFGPDITKESQLNVFASEVCLSLDMKYLTVTTISDIEMLRFSVNYPAFHHLSGELNRAVCSKDDRNNRERCAQNGVLNATRCFEDMPVIMSWPHFFEADPYYLDLVEGLRPDESRHGVFVDVEPLSGTTVRVAQRIQINMPLRAMPYPGYFGLPAFTMFPVMWIEKTGEINDDGINQMKDAIYSKFYALRSAAYGFLIISVVFVPVGVIVFVIYHFRIAGNSCRKRSSVEQA